jgi:hypothetical protein
MSEVYRNSRKLQELHAAHCSVWLEKYLCSTCAWCAVPMSSQSHFALLLLLLSLVDILVIQVWCGLAGGGFCNSEQAVVYHLFRLSILELFTAPRFLLCASFCCTYSFNFLFF